LKEKKQRSHYLGVRKETEKPLSRSVDSLVQFSYYELEYLWAEKSKKDGIMLFFSTETFDIVCKQKDFIEYQKKIFDLYIKEGRSTKDVCTPLYEKVDVEGETLYFVYNLKENIYIQ